MRFLLFQTNISVIKAETALMYDAVHLFAKALHDLDTSQQIDIQPLSCDGPDTWPHGYSLINYMKIVSSGVVIHQFHHRPLTKNKYKVFFNQLPAGRKFPVMLNCITNA